MLHRNTCYTVTYVQGSENQNAKWRCVLHESSSRKYGRSINEEDCKEKENGAFNELDRSFEISTVDL